MNIRPVNTEKEYDAALERIEILWGAKPGTSEANELDVLLVLVRVYEQTHHSVPAPSPIEAIKFIMDQQGLKQAGLIPYIGSRSKVSEILNGKRALTLSMIRSLHSGLGIPAEILIQEGSGFPDDGEDVDWNCFPVKEITNRGWVSGFDDKTQAEEIVRSLVASAGIKFSFANNACFRKGLRQNAKDNPYAILAWIWRVHAEARYSKATTDYRHGELDESFISKIAHLSNLHDGPLKAKEYLSLKGINLVIVPHFKKTYLDGVVLIDKAGCPIIGLTLRYDRLDNFWFTLAHELAHLIKGHVHNIEGNCIIDDLDLPSSTSKIEKEADEVAVNALIPRDLWEVHPAKETAHLSDVKDLSRKADVHHAIVAGRVRYHKKNYRLLSREVGNGQVKILFM